MATAQDSLVQKVSALRDQTIHRLDELGIPAYPVHYKKYFEEAFQENADIELSRAVTANTPEEVIDNSKQFMELARVAIEKFSQSHSEISKVADKQSNHLQDIDVDNLTSSSFLKIIEGLTALNDELVGELKKSEEQLTVISQQLDETLKISTTDPLTRVYNRKALLDDVEAVLAAGTNRDLSTILIILDADNFKNLNDTHGHVAGDKILHFLAQSFKSVLRTNDRVYRYGGEEFIVVLTRCENAPGLAVAEKLRAKVEQSRIIYGGETIRLTVSVGVTSHKAGDTFESFIARADDALYEAKRTGKNKVISRGML